MRTLVIMRHAHTEAGSVDRQRRLTSVGEEAAAARGVQLAAHVRPDLVRCSTAVRAVSTWEAVRSPLGSPAVELADRLYLASTVELLHAIRTCPDDRECLMVIAHNPGLSDLVRGIGEGSLVSVLSPADAVVLRSDAYTWADAANGRFTCLLRFP